MKPRMHAALFAPFLGLALLAGCSADGTAATVDGVAIPESAVTEEIQAFRTQNALEDPEAWASWLARNGQTPSSFREQTIDSLIDSEVVALAAQQEGISVDEAQVDTYIENAKSGYDSEEDWKRALEDSGLTEEAYRQNIRNSLLQSALQQSVAGDTEEAVATDEQIIDYFETNRSYYDGSKRSAHILFAEDDGDSAEAVLAQLQSGALTFEEAVREYSIDSDTRDSGGDLGWDRLRTFPGAYQQALGSLAVGELSAVVDTEYGKEIILCTDEFEAPAKMTDPSVLPQDIREEIEECIVTVSGSDSYEAWLEDYRNGLAITINAMPENAPYNVDTSAYDAEGAGE